jgi:nitrate reductase gamma subunit
MDFEATFSFVRGPLFTASFVFLVLGVVRIVLLQGVDLGRAWLRMRGSGLPWLGRVGGLAGQAWRSSPALEFKGWLIFITFLFYTLVIFLALFLIDHILLWYSGTGLWWRGMSKAAADGFALLALACGAALFLARVFHGPTRRLSDHSDYVIILLLLVTLGAGLVAAHPALAFPSYSAVMTVHVLGADLALFLFPFSRVAQEVFHPVRVDDPGEFARAALEKARGEARVGAPAPPL